MLTAVYTTPTIKYQYRFNEMSLLLYVVYNTTLTLHKPFAANSHRPDRGIMFVNNLYNIIFSTQVNSNAYIRLYSSRF